MSDCDTQFCLVPYQLNCALWVWHNAGFQSHTIQTVSDCDIQFCLVPYQNLMVCVLWHSAGFLSHTRQKMSDCDTMQKVSHCQVKFCLVPYQPVWSDIRTSGCDSGSLLLLAFMRWRTLSHSSSKMPWQHSVKYYTTLLGLGDAGEVTFVTRCDWDSEYSIYIYQYISILCQLKGFLCAHGLQNTASRTAVPCGGDVIAASKYLIQMKKRNESVINWHLEWGEGFHHCTGDSEEER